MVENKEKQGAGMVEPVTDPEKLPAGNVLENQKPYCPVHNVLMVATSSSKKRKSVYLKCPVRGCKSDGEKLIKPDVPAPKKPLHCPKCKSVCEVNEKRNSALTLNMKCSNESCDYDVNVARPDVAARAGMLRRSSESIMD